jgi:hypothetical protein
MDRLEAFNLRQALYRRDCASQGEHEKLPKTIPYGYSELVIPIEDDYLEPTEVKQSIYPRTPHGENA